MTNSNIIFTSKWYSRYHLPPSIIEFHNYLLPKYVQYLTPILYLILTLVPHVLHTLHTLTQKRRDGPPQRSKKKQKLLVSNHINPWTIHSSRLRLLSARASASITTRNTPDTGHVCTTASATALQLSSTPP